MCLKIFMGLITAAWFHSTHCFFLPLQIFLFCTYRVLYILYMMSSLGSEKARGPREKALPVATHTSQPQKQIQVSLSTTWPDILKTDTHSSPCRIRFETKNLVTWLTLQTKPDCTDYIGTPQWSLKKDVSCLEFNHTLTIDGNNFFVISDFIH